MYFLWSGQFKEHLASTSVNILDKNDDTKENLYNMKKVSCFSYMNKKSLWQLPLSTNFTIEYTM